MNRALFAAWLLAVTCYGGAIIREGDTWRYYKGTNAPASGWTNVVYDDTGWSSGPSGFGYDDSDDTTSLPDMSNGYVSVFTRKTFVISDTSLVTRLTLAADFDDGFVAYMNGNEIYRSNMAAGAIFFTNRANVSHDASRASGGNEKVFLVLSPSNLLNGANVLAVSGHNNATNSSDFSLIMELYTNITLVRGPILSLQHDQRVTVLWRTDVLTDSVVDYGLTTNYEAGTVSNGALVRQHIIELPALNPGTDYFYRVQSGGVVLSEKFFHAPPSSAQAFRFAVIGDFGTIYNNTRDVANRVGLQDADLLITVGDNIYNYGQPGSYDDSWFNHYTQTISRAAMMPVMGDHDIASNGGAPFTNNLALPTNGPAGFIERCYSFDFGNIHFVGIDNNPYNPGNSGQMTTIDNWVSNNLAASTQQWKICYLGYPPLTSWGDHDEDVNTKAHLLPIFERFGVDFVFAGDNHWYERINPRYGVNYFVTGGGGAALAATVNERYPYSAMVSNGVHSFTLCDVSGTVFRLRGVDKTGVVMDEYVFDQAHPFVMDGFLDNTNWIRVSTGVTFSAAIRSNFLYVACNDAGEGSDHFIYVADRLATNRPANWNKNATVMQWSAFLADENDNGEHDWYNAQDQRMTNLFAARAANFGVFKSAASTNSLEGTLDLFARFTNFPNRLYASAAAFQTTNNGGVLIPSGQAPAPVTNAPNSGSNIESNEFYGFNTRDIALDLPVAVAQSNQAVEAGMTATLNGSGSQSPSGYLLTYAWTRQSGPTGILANATSASASYTAATNPPVATNTLIQLVVNDSRFDSTGTVVVTVEPMVDADNDGLSNGEESTGANNVFTSIDPAGRLSNPALFDSDGDGVGDGLEALAGTDPTNGLSRFEIAESQASFGSNLVVTWNSVSNRNYALLAASNMLGVLNALATNIPAAPPLNSFTVPVSDAAQFYFIRTGQ